MAKITLNQALAALQGKLGRIVFKKINGKLYATRRAMPKKPRSPKQLAWQDRFKAASNFAKGVRQSPELLAFYEPIAKARGCRLREVVLSDAFSAPTIHSVDLSRFTGKPGGSISIRASDNFGVVRVSVQFKVGRTSIGCGGSTVRQRGVWRFTSVYQAPREPFEIWIKAYDRPGNCTSVMKPWPPPA